MGLIDAIGAGPVALDTCVFIYFIEEDPEFVGILDPLFATIDAGRLAAVASELTLMETLVVPYRGGSHDLAQAYERVLTRGRGLSLAPVSRGILRGAAWLRASGGVRTPDALHLATALAGDATAFVTNDRRLPDVPGLDVLQLRDFGRADGWLEPDG